MFPFYPHTSFFKRSFIYPFRPESIHNIVFLTRDFPKSLSQNFFILSYNENLFYDFYMVNKVNKKAAYPLYFKDYYLNTLFFQAFFPIKFTDINFFLTSGNTFQSFFLYGPYDISFFSKALRSSNNFFVSYDAFFFDYHKFISDFIVRYNKFYALQKLDSFGSLHIKTNFSHIRDEFLFLFFNLIYRCFICINDDFFFFKLNSTVFKEINYVLDSIFLKKSFAEKDLIIFLLDFLIPLLEKYQKDITFCGLSPLCKVPQNEIISICTKDSLFSRNNVYLYSTVFNQNICNVFDYWLTFCFLQGEGSILKILYPEYDVFNFIPASIDEILDLSEFLKKYFKFYKDAY